MSTANRDAVAATITAMKAAGLLEPVDAALCALCRSLAKSLDTLEPGAAYASCARAYLQATDRLRQLGSHDDHDRLTELLGTLSGPAVGHTENT